MGKNSKNIMIATFLLIALNNSSKNNNHQQSISLQSNEQSKNIDSGDQLIKGFIVLAEEIIDNILSY